MLAFPPDAAPGAVKINGHEVPEVSQRMLSYTHGWRIYGCVDAPPEGFEMTFALSGAKPVAAIVFDESYGLPPQGMDLQRARPSSATAIQSGDVSLVKRNASLAPE